MSMYNLLEYSDKYSKNSKNLWQRDKDERNDNLTDSNHLSLK